MSLQETLGLEARNQRGEVAFIVGVVCTCMVVADIANVADATGQVKKILNKILPSVFKADKFRTAAATTGK